MRCVACGAPDSRVIDSRPLGRENGVRRRRSCTQCGRRFTTREAVTIDYATIPTITGEEIMTIKTTLERALRRASRGRP